MPELPEVEHVTRRLAKAISGRTITTAELRRDRLAPHNTSAEFAQWLENAAVSTVHRRGKHILIELSSGFTLIVHLRMSGRFALLTPDDDDPKFTHAAFHFPEGDRLIFLDQRHFGMMRVVETPALFATKELAILAPEPFSDDFSTDYLAERLRRSSKTIKEFLLDQTKVCGLGNIYASEVLYRSGIGPKRRGRTVGRARIPVLRQHIIDVLREAVEAFEQVAPHPVYIGEGIYGAGTEPGWDVYDREGQPCAKCASPIRRMRQGGRSTYYCAKCQR